MSENDELDQDIQYYKCSHCLCEVAAHLDGQCLCCGFKGTSVSKYCVVCGSIQLHDSQTNDCLGCIIRDREEDRA